MGGRGGSSDRNGSGGFPRTDADAEGAAEYYVSGDGMWINQYLRGRIDDPGFQFTPQDAEYLRDLDRAVSNPLMKDQTLYRSVDASAIFGNISDLQYENLVSGLVYGDKYGLGKSQNILNATQGKTLTEKGFMSTTKDAQLAHDWGGFSGSSKPVVLELKVPKGTTGKDLSGHYMAQNEVLLSRGQQYRINGISAKNGNVYVTAEVVKRKK